MVFCLICNLIMNSDRLDAALSNIDDILYAIITSHISFRNNSQKPLFKSFLPVVCRIDSLHSTNQFNSFKRPGCCYTVLWAPALYFRNQFPASLLLCFNSHPTYIFLRNENDTIPYFLIKSSGKFLEYFPS